MKLKRQPRNQMRIAAAMAVLQLSRSGIRDQIYKYERLRIANEKQRTGPTSPIKLYESEVTKLAEEWGILS